MNNVQIMDLALGIGSTNTVRQAVGISGFRWLRYALHITNTSTVPCHFLVPISE